MNLILRNRAAIFAGSLLVFWPMAAIAGPDFGYVYTAEIERPGETEIAAWATERGGTGDGHYDAEDYRIELERGLSRNIQLSGYVLFSSHHIRPSSDSSNEIERDFAFQGFSGEAEYQLRSPDHGRLGIAAYVEPEWSRISKVSGQKSEEFGVELKVIVEKDFLADRLVWAANLTFEPEWEKPQGTRLSGGNTEKELAAEISTGLAYRVTRHWWLGGEGRYHSIYPDWTRALHRENYAVQAGPMVHFDAGKWEATASFLPQLFGSPGKAGSSLELHDHQKSELRFKLAYDL